MNLGHPGQNTARWGGSKFAHTEFHSHHTLKPSLFPTPPALVPDVIRELLGGIRPGWESDLRLARERGHSQEGSFRTLAQRGF